LLLGCISTVLALIVLLLGWLPSSVSVRKSGST